MPTYSYLLPLISICPPPGYRLFQSPNLDAIGARLDRPDAEVRMARSLILGEEVLASREDVLLFRGGACANPVAPFELESPAESCWHDGAPLAYLETHFTAEPDAQFTSQFPPSFYTIYSGPERKSFYSDNALKYGNTVTIYQIEAFGAWVEGYPACQVDPARDIDESVVLINPFLRPAIFDLTLEGIEAKLRFRVEPQTGRRIGLARAFGIGAAGWSGQVYVSGRNRVVMYVAKHSLTDPSRITTVEHSNPYRGEPTHIPFSRMARQRLGERLRALVP